MQRLIWSPNRWARPLPRGVAWLSIAVAAVSWSGSLSAQTQAVDGPAAQERVELTFVGDASCPSAESFRRAVTARSARVLFVTSAGHRQLRVTVSNSGTLAHGEVRLGRPGEDALPRRIVGSTCAEVVEALVLVAVLAIDPEAMKGLAPGTSAAASKPSAAAGKPNDTSGADNAPSAEQASERAQAASPDPHHPGYTPSLAPAALPAEATPPPDEEPPPGPPLEEEADASRVDRTPATRAHKKPGSPVRVTLLAGGETITSPGPVPMLLGSLAVHLELGSSWHSALRLAVRAGAGPSSDLAIEGATARFSLAAARLEACPATWRFDRFGLSGWLAVEGGALQATGIASNTLYSGSSAVTAWFALSQIARLDVELGWGWLVEVSGGLVEPLVRDTFVFESIVAHEVPPLGGMASIGVGYRFFSPSPPGAAFVDQTRGRRPIYE